MDITRGIDMANRNTYLSLPIKTFQSNRIYYALCTILLILFPACRSEIITDKTITTNDTKDPDSTTLSSASLLSVDNKLNSGRVDFTTDSTTSLFSRDGAIICNWVVEQMPELIGGLQSVQSKILYPQQAREEGVEGRVLVVFTVDETGAVVDPAVIRGIGHGFDEEAIRVIKIASFKPAIDRGKAKRVRMTLPITFKIK